MNERMGQTVLTSQTGSELRLLHLKARETISPSAELGELGTQGFPKFQCSLCHDWFRGKNGADGFIFSGGGAVMAPLRRAGLTGSLLVLGDRSD